jgi:hypothetical protein
MDSMDEKIGVVAGKVWNFLHENGETSSILLKSNLGLSDTLLFLSLGWLSRENKIKIISVPREHSHNISIK